MKPKSINKIDWIAIIKSELVKVNDYVKVDVHSDWKRFSKQLAVNS